MNPAIHYLDTSYALYARPGDHAFMGDRHIVITSARGRRLRFYYWRPSPLPRRLP